MAVKRVTSMLLVSDVPATVVRYKQQGFRAFPTDEPDCVGLVAEATHTGIIVLGQTFATRTMPAGAVEELRKGVGVYIWVDSLGDVASNGSLLGEIETSHGTRERYMREDGGLVTYAEQLA